MPPQHPQHVIVVGEMAVGKTTVGSRVARALALAFLDSDVWIEETAGRTSAEIAAGRGVGALHEMEVDALIDMVAVDRAAVIAAASSVVDSERGRELLRSCKTVWLDASDATLEERARRGNHRRPVGADERIELRKRRQAHLEEVADIRIDTDGKRPVEVVEEVERALGDSRILRKCPTT